MKIITVQDLIEGLTDSEKRECDSIIGKCKLKIIQVNPQEIQRLLREAELEARGTVGEAIYYMTKRRGSEDGNA